MRDLSALPLCLFGVGTAQAHGLLIPEEKTLPPLAMLNHKVKIAIEDQVAVTRVEQTFRNHTDRPLEATYVFPVPKGASVNKFTMWVDGKEVKGELVEAEKARADLHRHRPPHAGPRPAGVHGQQPAAACASSPSRRRATRRSTLSYTVRRRRKTADLVEYVYPLKTDGKATSTLEEFSIEPTIKSQHAVQNVYSPTHAITLKRDERPAK